LWEPPIFGKLAVPEKYSRTWAGMEANTKKDAQRERTTKLPMFPDDRNGDQQETQCSGTQEMFIKGGKSRSVMFKKKRWV